MAARRITMARVRLSKQTPDGPTEEVGEVLFSRVPVRSDKDYCGVLKDILDLQQAKELSEEIMGNPGESSGEVGEYIWQR